MKRSLTIASHSKICLALVLLLLFPSAYAQTEQSSTAPDSIEVVIKDTETQQTDTFVIDTAGIIAITDGIMAQQRKRRELSKFRPDPIRSMWLGLVIPGAGQIYNRKYWKLPIIYGGFLGCIYALTWNTQMYSDYSQAYLDITDSDPNTKSYEKMLPPRYSIVGQEARFQSIFQRRKDLYRRYRDLSIFAFGGVYLLSVIDAYVDAELSTFDISRDLSLHIQPTMIETSRIDMHHRTATPGVQCVLNF
ncbi:MAG: hypothetical protein IKP36_06855 [Bacteroidaceae bacterium]|nr:hypothetical protein [Bacteroidaceae bacterium]